MALDYEHAGIRFEAISGKFLTANEVVIPLQARFIEKLVLANSNIYIP